MQARVPGRKSRSHLPAQRPREGTHCGVTAPPETDVEMARRLQEEKREAEQVWRGQDADTLAVVREAAGPLMWGQVEGLGAPS